MLNLPMTGFKLPMPRLHVSIVLFDAFSNMVQACLLEPLRVVRDQTGADIHWTILTETNRSLDSASGITVTPDVRLAEAPAADLVLVIGGDGFRRRPVAGAFRRDLGALIRGATVIAADTGAWILARYGYLTGRKATLHWQLMEEFTETFPDVCVVPDSFVCDGPFWTCGSAAAALDVMLHFLRERFGPATAFDAGAMFLHDNAKRHGASFPERALPFAASARLKRVLQLMSEALEQTLTVPHLARTANMSERSLHRLFRTELHMPPGRYYLLLRLARARELARYSDLSLADIAVRCGFADATTLTRSFLRHHGTNLRSVRKDL